jgi:hypothetical protein
MKRIKNNLSPADVESIVQGAIAMRDHGLATLASDSIEARQKVMTGVAFYVMTRAHEGQTRDDGAPYVKHTRAVGDAQQSEREKQVGYLHDAPEDTAVKIPALRRIGFDDDVIGAVELLSDKTGFYFDKSQVIGVYGPLAYHPKTNDCWDNGKQGTTWKHPLYTINIAYFTALDEKLIEPGTSVQAFSDHALFPDHIARVLLSYELLDKFSPRFHILHEESPERFQDLLSEVKEEKAEWKDHIRNHSSATESKPTKPDDGLRGPLENTVNNLIHHLHLPHHFFYFDPR